MEKIKQDCRMKKTNGLEAGIIIYHHKYNNNSINQKDNLNKIFHKIIEMIEGKKYYMLGPEKSKTARFIAENFMEIYNTFKSNIKKE